MTIYHWDLHKRKKTGGAKKPYRGKRKYESGNAPIETRISKIGSVVEKRKCKGGGLKFRLKEAKYVNVNTPEGKTIKSEIVSLVENPSNPLYAKRGIITRGSVLRTSVGLVRITSKPGSDGVLNGVLIAEQR